ncbi:hypothetical protein BCR33DRAFT_89779 [Rhizoclosmatium globosum]|uniref:NmrA-like domain-containing protein n=1 Tax=Rhizoclosmatium globosum TaxID=329046 RepID=A0A1Y2AQK3_9FUNG|nr:hypothetical protein BCR33DRAFT_89779 [Rhizoclosmatium globosum]|eukprot:ORY24843.1 hypothetical protein BCR33DRAFT_89779 [Rhizoclosmatium globosum]
MDLIQSKGGRIVKLDIEKDRTETVKVLKGIDAVVCFGLVTNEFMDDCGKAGVKRFIPNVFGVDYNVNDLPWLRPRIGTHDYLENSKMEYTEIVNGYFADFGNLKHPSILGLNWDTMVAKYASDKPISFTFPQRRCCHRYSCFDLFQKVCQQGFESGR